jgi:hypothetical protein
LVADPRLSELSAGDETELLAAEVGDQLLGIHPIKMS